MNDELINCALDGCPYALHHSCIIPNVVMDKITEMGIKDGWIKNKKDCVFSIVPDYAIEDEPVLQKYHNLIKNDKI